MDLTKLLRAYVEQMAIVEAKVAARVSTETESLMFEIEAFHLQVAIDKSLDDKDPATFLKLTEMEEYKCLLN